MKLVWRFRVEQGKLWSRVLRGKYGLLVPSMAAPQVKPYHSYIWKSICTMWNDVSTNASRSIGNGRCIAFWNDHWMDDLGPLSMYMTSDLPCNIRNLHLKDMISTNGQWIWHKFRDWLPDYVCSIIVRNYPVLFDTNMDGLIWNLTPSGSFSTKSAASLVNEEIESPFHGLWKTIWKTGILERIRSFLWLVTHDRLPTRALCKRRNIVDDDICQACLTDSESTVHVLRDCSLAIAVWN